MKSKLANLIHLISYQGFFGKLIRLPLCLIPPQQVMPVLTGVLRGKRWIAGSSNHGCWLGSYELPKQRVFARYIRPGMVIYDVGAHVGFYTLLASALTGPAGRVIAFEPLPNNVTFLRQHIDLNSLSNVSVVEMGVADTVGVTRFALGRSSYMGKLAISGDLEVQVSTIDTLILQSNYPIPDVIKMDIEGGEARALLGMRRMLTQASPVIFLATHGDHIREECRLILTELGYTMRSLESDQSQSEHIVQRM